MRFIEFKKLLLDAEISLPKFCKLTKISEKNLQTYKNKENIPNTIATTAACFAKLHALGIDYRSLIVELNLDLKTKKGGGFKKNKNKNKEEKE